MHDQSGKTILYIAYVGLFTALALIFSYVETLIPLPLPVYIPGIKLGLANSMTLLLFYIGDPFMAFLVLILRVLLSSAMFSGLSTMAYSLAGGIFSFAMMLIMKQILQFSIYGVSIIGGVSHNLAQITAAVMILHTPGLFADIPILIISGILTGALNAVISRGILSRIPPSLQPGIVLKNKRS